MIYNKDLLGFKACPLCGEKDNMELMGDEMYEHAFSGWVEGIRCVSISCRRCRLDVYEHSEGNYAEKVSILRNKWNCRPYAIQEDFGGDTDGDE